MPWQIVPVAVLASQFMNARFQSKYRPEPKGTLLPDKTRWGALPAGRANFSDPAGIFATTDVELISSGHRWTEGPVWSAADKALHRAARIDGCSSARVEARRCYFSRLPFLDAPRRTLLPFQIAARRGAAPGTLWTPSPRESFNGGRAARPSWRRRRAAPARPRTCSSRAPTAWRSFIAASHSSTRVEERRRLLDAR